MSDFEQLFVKAIDASRRGKTRLNLVTGIVKSIEGDTCTVDQFVNVRLNTIIDDLESQFTVYPKVDSEVIMGRIEGKDTMFILQASEIDKVTIKIGEQLFEMKDGKFSIKTGNVSLKSILNDGFTQLSNAVITTPSGPGAFSPADITVFNELKAQVNQLLL